MDEKFVFVSYSHTEIAKVEMILRAMEREGITYWYDRNGENIDARKNWTDFINNKIKKSSMFLCFVSEDTTMSKEVQREIREALNRKGNNYAVLFIILGKVYLGDMDEDIYKYIKDHQIIVYEGMTDSFYHRLIGEKVFPDCVINEEKRKLYNKKPWRDRERFADLSSIDLESLCNNSYVYYSAFPEIKEGENFYRVKKDQISPFAVTLSCLDNQWCPQSFYTNKKFLSTGFLNEELLQEKKRIQKKELFASLLHNSQLIINRAYFWNGDVFSDWYKDSGDDADALKALLCNGTLTIYLYKEHSPCDMDKPSGFDIHKENMNAFIKFCKDCVPYCYRLDWENDTNNDYLIGKHLSAAFKNSCITMACNEGDLHDDALRLGLNESETKVYKNKWIKVRRAVLSLEEKGDSNFNRDKLYQNFVVKKGSKTPDCIISRTKQLSAEIKQVADHIYNKNLADFLGIKMLVPNDSPFYGYASAGTNIVFLDRKIKTDELLYAISDFDINFMSEKSIRLIENEITLSDIYKIRCLSSFKDYIKTTENSMSRAHLKEMNFHDLENVWIKYNELINEIVTQDIKGCKKEEIMSALSLIVRIGTLTVYIIYRKCGCNTYSVSGEMANHEVKITIDYKFCDIFSEDESIFVPSLRLFEGTANETVSLIKENLVKKLQNLNFKEETK